MDNTQNYITSSCKIKDGIIKINGEIDYKNSENNSHTDFLIASYKHYQISYAKFYKMDSLCKLAFIASEVLLKTNKITEKYKPDDIAVIISNSSSSLEIDTEHQKTISNKENHFPSPTIFVYTLPNILIGEIAIRNKIKGENSFFIFDKFDAEFTCDYINSLLNSDKAKYCIGGWVEYFEDKYEAFLFTIEKKNGNNGIDNNIENLNKLYTN
jgi:hypothetical protein